MISRLFLFILSFMLTVYVVVTLATYLSERHEKDFYHSLSNDFTELQTSLRSEKSLNTFMKSEDIKKYTSEIIDNQTHKNDDLKPKFQKLLNQQAGIFREGFIKKTLTRDTGEPAENALAEYFKEKASKIKNEDLLPYFEKYSELSSRIDNYGAWKTSTFFIYVLTTSLCVLGVSILILYMSMAFYRETLENSIKHVTYVALTGNVIIYALVFMIFYFCSP